MEASVRLSRERNESKSGSGRGDDAGEDGERHVAADNAPPPQPAQRRQSADVAMTTPACRAGADGGGGEEPAGPFKCEL